MKSEKPSNSVRTEKLLSELDTLMKHQEESPWKIGDLINTIIEKSDLTISKVIDRYPQFDLQKTAYTYRDVSREWDKSERLPSSKASWWDHQRVSTQIKALRKEGQKLGIPVKIDKGKALREMMVAKIGSQRAEARDWLRRTYAPALQQKVMEAKEEDKEKAKAKAIGKVSMPMMDHPENANPVFVVELDTFEQEETQVLHRTLIVAKNEAEAYALYGAIKRKKSAKTTDTKGKPITITVKTNAGVTLFPAGHLVASPGIYGLIQLNLNKGATSDDLKALADELTLGPAKKPKPNKPAKKVEMCDVVPLSIPLNKKKE